MINQYIKLTSASVLWGTVGLFVFWTHLDSVVIAFFRCVFGMVFLLSVSCPVFSEVKKYSIKDGLLITLGSTFVVFNWLALFKAYQLISITLASMLYYTQPIILLLLGGIFLNEKILLKNMVFIVVSFLGVILLLNSGFHSNTTNSPAMLGIACALIASFFYAAATIVAKKLRHIEPRIQIFMQMFMGLIILVLPASASSWTFSLHQWECLIIMGTVHTVLAFILFYDAIKTIPVSLISVIGYISPVVAIGTDIVFFNHHVYLIQWVGVFFILWAGFNVSMSDVVSDDKINNRQQPELQSCSVNGH
jgi:drug/metabolite transporter (DMT)-like permease